MAGSSDGSTPDGMANTGSALAAAGQDADASFGQLAVGSTIQPCNNATIHASLQLKEVHYVSNHVVEKDTLGNFVAPEWLHGRKEQWPVCYTRGATVSLIAVFQVVISPTTSETVAVRGRTNLGSVTLEWTGSVQVAPGATEVRTVQLSSSATLPNEVACYDPAEIAWEAQPPSEPWGSAGTSRNVIYAVLATPQGTPAYWTLLDISCRAAHGATSQSQVVERSFIPFTSRTLTRKRDNQGLTYWNPDTTDATNTQQLLARADGSGQCGSWSEFLIDMYKVHGITTGEKVLIVRTISEWQSSSVGFLVKNWRFQAKGSRPAPFTHVLYLECVELPGIPGQRNPNPPPAFFNHFIVRCLGQFYDPSYGAGPISDQTSWEVNAIDGLFSGRDAGYPKSTHKVAHLLQFWSLMTKGRI
jgi:hypothetical protein